ncbi:MAG: ThuA domain-containing protein [Clostridia bacterium]|nr:ThuA domain-containing protein [Clostridia bacterium]
MIRVTVWNENIHEKEMENVAKIYPKGIHGTIAEALRQCPDLEVREATLDMPYQGLSDEVLANTDVLIWWGHCGHHLVDDALVERIRSRVWGGMGFIALHSAHMSKPFRTLMGTPCTLRWRDGDFERLWVVDPQHPIARGLGEYIELEEEEMYGEPFGISNPDDVVFMGWFSGGEVFRSGCTFRRGAGKIFYFQPGHETCPIYHHPQIQQILRNAVHWAAPADGVGSEPTCPCAIPSPEAVRKHKDA